MSMARLAGAPGFAIGAGATVSVKAGYCINLRGRMADACDLCQRACHAKAITLSLDEVEVDPALCVGCGACVPACPGGAFSHDRFDPEALPAQAVRDGAARLTCGAVADPSASGVVPCHKMTDARLLAAIFAQGAAVIEIVGTDSCAGCPGGDARPALTTAQRTLGKWFGEAAPQVELLGAAGQRARAEEPASDTAVQRRHFLRGAFRALAPEPEDDADPGMPSFDDPRFDEAEPDQALARPVPYQHLLAEARARLPFRADGPTGATGRSIGPDCSGCMVCADLCPTGALGDDSGSQGGQFYRIVSFDAALCTNCTLCTKVCPMTAISTQALRGLPAATAGRKALYARRDATCSNCGAHFAPGSDGGSICPGCQNDVDMDDDWLDMLRG